MKPPKGTNYYLSMRGQEERWLKYKMAEMPSFFENTDLKKYNNTFRCNSRCLSMLTEVYEALYKDGKRHLTMEILDPLMDIALAVWFLDSGGKTGRGKNNAYLNTTKLGEEGTEVAIQYFNELDLNCNLNKSKDRLRILFTVPGTYQFFKVIAHRLPQFMIYRMGYLPPNTTHQ